MVDYPQMLADWVKARCDKRVKEHGKPVPGYVKDWLGGIEWNPAAQDTVAPAPVIGWLFKSLEDPNWPCCTSSSRQFELDTATKISR